MQRRKKVAMANLQAPGRSASRCGGGAWLNFAKRKYTTQYTVETVTYLISYLSDRPVLGEYIERSELPLSLLVTSLGYLTFANGKTCFKLWF